MTKIIKRTAIIGAVLALTVGITRAVWSDSATSTDNVFQAGTLDLKLSNDNSSYSDSVTATWGGSGMVPGGAAVSGSLYLKNTGNPAADHVHLAFTNTITEAAEGPGTSPGNPMDEFLEVTAFTYDGQDLIAAGLISDSNGNGFIDLDDLEAIALPGVGESTGDSVVGDKTLALADIDTPHTVVLSVKLNMGAADENQGDAVTTIVTATLHQADGQ